MRRLLVFLILILCFDLLVDQVICYFAVLNRALVVVVCLGHRISIVAGFLRLYVEVEASALAFMQQGIC